MTNLTRRQTRQWLQPIRKAFTEIKAGEVDTIRGYPVTRIDHADEYARTDWAINGFVALIERLLPSLPADPMRRVAKKLEAGTPLVQTEIDACLRLLNAAVHKALAEKDFRDALSGLGFEPEGGSPEEFARLIDDCYRFELRVTSQLEHHADDDLGGRCSGHLGGRCGRAGG